MYFFSGDLFSSAPLFYMHNFIRKFDLLFVEAAVSFMFNISLSLNVQNNGADQKRLP